MQILLLHCNLCLQAILPASIRLMLNFLWFVLLLLLNSDCLAYRCNLPLYLLSHGGSYPHLFVLNSLIDVAYPAWCLSVHPGLLDCNAYDYSKTWGCSLLCFLFVLYSTCVVLCIVPLSTYGAALLSSSEDRLLPVFSLFLVLHYFPIPVQILL